MRRICKEAAHKAMRKILLTILTLLCLAAAPAMASGSAPSSDKEGAEKDGKGPQYVKIAPIVLPLVGEQGVEQIISLVIAIEVPDRKTADHVIVMSPRLNDAYMTDLYGAIDRRDSFRNGLVDITRIKERIEKASVRILGPNSIKSVLVQAVMQRPA